MVYNKDPLAAATYDINDTIVYNLMLLCYDFKRYDQNYQYKCKGEKCVVKNGVNV